MEKTITTIEIELATICLDCQKMWLNAKHDECPFCRSEELIKVCQDEIVEPVIADYFKRGIS